MKLTARHCERFRRVIRKSNGSVIGFRMDEIRLANGLLRSREYITHPGAVGALAFTGAGNILLVKQYRYPVGQYTYEIPAGKLDKNESPLACMRRELEEETGYRAKTIRKLLSFWPTAAFSNEIIHLYIAENLIATQASPDDDEFLDVVEITPRALETLIRRGRIQDSKTLIAYLAWTRGIASIKK